MDAINNLLIQYGYIVLFIAPMFETLALPIPGELLMLYCGVLIYTGKLNLYLSIFIGFSGVASGLTIAYIIGIFIGINFFIKYGKYFGIKPKKIEKVSKWFNRYGTRLLLISCFIPGVRHITGYFSGIIKVDYKKFILNAYIGAFLWILTFISLGNVLGEDIKGIEMYLSRYIIIIMIIIGFSIILYYVIRKYRKIIKYFIYKRIQWMVKNFSSKVSILPIIFSLICFGFLILIINIFKSIDVVNFNKLNELFDTIIINTFNGGVYYIIIVFKIVSSIYFIGVIILLVIFYVVKKGKNKILDLGFIILLCLGGFILQQILNYNKFYMNTNTSFLSKLFSSYKGETCVLTITSYGMLLRFLFKYNLKKIIRNIAMVCTFIVCLFTGISTVFLSINSLGYVVFNFIIGFIWLTINIFLFYIEEIIEKISKSK